MSDLLIERVDTIVGEIEACLLGSGRATAVTAWTESNMATVQGAAWLSYRHSTASHICTQKNAKIIKGEVHDFLCN